jgi:hypothetical protein
MFDGAAWCGFCFEKYDGAAMSLMIEIIGNVDGARLLIGI